MYLKFSVLLFFWCFTNSSAKLQAGLFASHKFVCVSSCALPASSRASKTSWSTAVKPVVVVIVGMWVCTSLMRRSSGKSRKLQKCQAFHMNIHTNIFVLYIRVLVLKYSDVSGIRIHNCDSFSSSIGAISFFRKLK